MLPMAAYVPSSDPRARHNAASRPRWLRRAQARLTLRRQRSSLRAGREISRQPYGDARPARGTDRRKLTRGRRPDRTHLPEPTTTVAIKASPARPGRVRAIARTWPVRRSAGTCPPVPRGAQPPDRRILRERLFQQFSVDGKTSGTRATSGRSTQRSRKILSTGFRAVSLNASLSHLSGPPPAAPAPAWSHARSRQRPSP